MTEEAPRTVALAGNPNTGKTTLFNALTGLALRTGNYPGVTVEKTQGRLVGEPTVDVLDLPGTYSLAARSPDEMVAADVMLGRQAGTPRPDAVVVVVDASNLDRNLYLATQVMETGLPVVLALNMSDTAAARGIVIDAGALSQRLGIPVVPLVARSGVGLPELKAALLAACDAEPAPVSWSWPPEVEAALSDLSGAVRDSGRDSPAFELRRALIDEGGEAERRLLSGDDGALRAALSSARDAAGGAAALQALEADIRYGFIGEVIAASLERPDEARVTLSERADRILTHRLWGTLLLVGIGYTVFMSIFAWAGPLMDLVDGAFGAMGEAIASLSFLGDGAVKSLLVDGIIAGVGGVVIFLPQILILFGFIAVLEDCGYMARAAFLMDRLLCWCGLSGRSFIPMLSSFACAVPGIMATRTIESRRDRLVTILVAPLMSCSARIPVYVILIAAFVPDRPVLRFLNLQAVVFASMYFVGILTAVAVAWLLRRGMFTGPTSSFLMELPPYKVPSFKTVLRRMTRQGSSFLSRAGTLILASTVVIWALAYWPRDASIDARAEAQLVTARQDVQALRSAGSPPEQVEAAEAELEELAGRLAAETGATHLRQSTLGRLGRTIEPLFSPIGWDWKVSVAVIASFPAREVVVSTLGVIYGLGEVDEESDALRDRMRASRWEDGPRKGEPVMDLAGALALMVFFALCAQCAATLVTIGKETGGWRWPVFAFVYMTTLAYGGALVTAVVVRGVVG